MTRLALLFGAACAVAVTQGAAAQGDAAQTRGAFALELAGFRFVEPEIDLNAPPPDRVVFHLLDPIGPSVPPGAIRTTINGEPAGTIQTVARTQAGRSVTCDLRRSPRFALQPGRNVLGIRVEGHPYAASFVVFLAAPAAGAARSSSTPLIAHEKRRANTGSDTEPATINVSAPPERINAPFDQPTPFTVRGTADDNRGVLSVSIDGVPARLKPASGPKASAGALEFREEVVVPAGATQVAVEALDRAGNVSRALLRIARPVAVFSSAIRGRRAAVIAGVSRYAHPDDGLGNLKFAARDAQSVVDLLKDPLVAGWSESNIEVLIDQRATRAGLRDALERAAAGLQSEDVLFVYIAAHGAADPFERSGGSLYLLLHDGRLSDLPRTALPMEELQTFLRSRVTARVVALIDVCHSATILGAREGAQPIGASLATRPGIAVITSSGVGEVSRERPDLDGGHGVFTYAVLQALRGGADANHDGLITAAELFSFVHHHVRELTGGRQNPEALPGGSADLPIVKTKR